MTVREYEKIFAENCPKFDELSKFASASEFFNLGWQYVQAKNYVGVIRLPSGFQIEILPKIAGETQELRGLVVEMIRTLKNFPNKKFLNADLDTARLDLYEIFIRIYLEMVSDLVKRGLKSSYIEREDNLNVFKGKLLVEQHIRKNFAHAEKFFVAYDEYSLNRPEHRLIKATLLKILRTTKENFRIASRFLGDFDSVEPSFNYAKDFATVSIDRTNHGYQTVMAWTKIFLSGKSFTPFAGKSDVMALLFDMNKLFESYVAAHIKKYFSKDFEVKTQIQEKYLFDNSTKYKLIPDILLKGGDETIILDTKWKFEPTEADMYQMFVYAKRYDSRKIFLLCPPNCEENFYRTADFSIQIVSVDIFNMKNFLDKLNKLF